MRTIPLLVATLLAASAQLAAPSALACGGTFCDRPIAQPNMPPPAPMPVDQTGENILFVMDGQTVEAHVQIQYQGNPERFAWVVPVQSEPLLIAPGSQPLFNNIANATVPRLQQSPGIQGCNSFGGGTFGCAASDSAESGGSDASPAAGSVDFGSPQGKADDGGLKVKQEVVGSYEVAILSGGTPEELLTWLDDNSYIIAPRTAELLTSYIETKHVFLALKLIAGAGIDEIHPISFSYKGDQPCIPIKLTAVAAVDDMSIRAYFLAKDRFVPSNYKHIILNDARFDWIAPFLTQGQTPITPGSTTTTPRGPSIDNSGYKNAVSKAVDSPIAMGRAFVTEYAGPSSRVPRTGITSNSWDFSSFVITTPSQVVSRLLQPSGADGAILTCASGASSCTSPYPILLTLLRKYIPNTGTLSDTAFYSCSSCIDGSFAKSEPFQFEAFSSEYEQLVLGPSRRAVDVLNQPVLTRLFTTISPAEMTADPEFRRLPGGPVVDNTSMMIQRVRECDGVTQTRVLPSGREVLVSTPGTSQLSWPTFGDDMPWAERVEDYGLQGSAPVVLVDNKTAIDQSLAAHHKARGWSTETEFTFTPNSCSYGRGKHRSLLVRAFLGLALLGLVVRRSRRQS